MTFPSASGRLLAAILATIAIVAACSGGAATPASPAASSAPEPSTAAGTAIPASLPAPSVTAQPSLTPAPLPSFDVAAAAAAYLAAATARNTASAAALAKLPSTNATLKQLHAWGLAFAKADLKFVDQVRAIAFPPTMTSKVTLYLQQRSTSAALELKVGSAKTLDAALSYSDQINELSASAIATANSIRADLGLPPAPNLHN
jgi:hypothetical protein